MNRVAIILDEFESAVRIIDKYRYKDVLFEFRIDMDDRLIELIDTINSDKCIITLRSISEGGNSENKNRAELISELAGFKPKYLDIEIDRDIIPEVDGRTTLILSKHDYSDNMLSVSKKYREQLDKYHLQSNRVLYKFVGKPVDTLDMIVSYNLLSDLDRHVILGIGKNAEISRTCLDQEFAFGASKEGDIIQYKYLMELDDNSIRTGLLGKKLDYSKSPAIHNSLFRSADIHGYYHIIEALDDRRAELLLQELIDLEFTGLNVTVPYKSLIAKISDKRTNNVELTNAANTISFINGNLIAENTDVTGFAKFIKNNSIDEYSKVTIIGAGGAARAVAVSMLDNNFEVTMLNRSESRFDEFPEELIAQINTGVLSKGENRAEVYIDATSLGLYGKSTTEIYSVGNAKVMINLNYNADIPENTSDTIYFDGKQMLFYQAQEAFNIWNNTNLEHDFELFRKIFE